MDDEDTCRDGDKDMREVCLDEKDLYFRNYNLRTTTEMYISQFLWPYTVNFVIMLALIVCTNIMFYLEYPKTSFETSNSQQPEIHIDIDLA